MEEVSKATAVRNSLGLLYDDDVAAVLKIDTSTLKNRRSRGDAPPSAKVGNQHITLIRDLERWIAGRKAR